MTPYKFYTAKITDACCTSQAHQLHYDIKYSVMTKCQIIIYFNSLENINKYKAITKILENRALIVLNGICGCGIAYYMKDIDDCTLDNVNEFNFRNDDLFKKYVLQF